MLLEMFASPPSHLPVIVCVLTSSTLRNKSLTSSRPRNIFLMRLESHAAQSAQCMRLKPMPVPHLVGLDRPCVHIQQAQRQTQSHPASWLPAGTTPVFRLREITHENPNTTGESFRVPPPRRPGAKAQSLRPCYAHVHESNSVSRAPQLSPGQTERLRPRESIHENRHTT